MPWAAKLGACPERSGRPSRSRAVGCRQPFEKWVYDLRDAHADPFRSGRGLPVRESVGSRARALPRLRGTLRTSERAVRARCRGCEVAAHGELVDPAEVLAVVDQVRRPTTSSPAAAGGICRGSARPVDRSRRLILERRDGGRSGHSLNASSLRRTLVVGQRLEVADLMPGRTFGSHLREVLVQHPGGVYSGT